MTRELRITGRGKISIPPDQIILTFPVSVESIDYGTAIRGLNKLTEMLRKVIDNNAISRDDLKTLDFSVDTVTKWNKKTKEHVFAGYEAQHKMEIELPFDNELTNSIIIGLSEIEGDINFRISFSVQDKDKYKRTLIVNAITDARINAELIAKTTGVRLKQIKTIDYSFSEVLFRSEPLTLYEESCMCTEESYLPDINPKDINTDENITIVWEIE